MEIFNCTYHVEEKITGKASFVSNLHGVFVCVCVCVCVCFFWGGVGGEDCVASTFH
jgi:hypothetical protein